MNIIVDTFLTRTGYNWHKKLNSGKLELDLCFRYELKKCFLYELSFLITSSHSALSGTQNTPYGNAQKEKKENKL